MKTVLIPTKLDKVAANLLTQKGYAVIQDAETDLLALCQAHPEAEALIVRSEKVTPSITLRHTSGIPVLRDIPKKHALACGSLFGVESPLKYGRKVTPSQPGAACAASPVM